MARTHLKTLAISAGSGTEQTAGDAPIGRGKMQGNFGTAGGNPKSALKGSRYAQFEKEAASGRK